VTVHEVTRITVEQVVREFLRGLFSTR
jgi:hypothetical protein